VRCRTGFRALLTSIISYQSTGKPKTKVKGISPNLVFLSHFIVFICSDHCFSSISVTIRPSIGMVFSFLFFARHCFFLLSNNLIKNNNLIQFQHIYFASSTSHFISSTSITMSHMLLPLQSIDDCCSPTSPRNNSNGLALTLNTLYTDFYRLLQALPISNSFKPYPTIFFYILYITYTYSTLPTDPSYTIHNLHNMKPISSYLSIESYHSRFVIEIFFVFVFFFIHHLQISAHC